MRNKITTKELIEKRFSKEQAEQIIEQAENEIKEIKWGGKRQGAGRKPKGEILPFVRRLSAKENKFIDYMREHHLNIDELMEG